MLTDKQRAIILPFLPLSRGIPRVDDLRIVGGILFVICHGLPWHAAPPEYSPYKTPYSRWRRWSRKGLFALLQEVLSALSAETDVLMIDSTFSRVQRSACSLGLKSGGQGGKSSPPEAALDDPAPTGADALDAREIGRTEGGINSKVHALADARGRPMLFHLVAGQKSDCKGAGVLLKNLPAAKMLVADRACYADKIRNWLEEREMDACIRPRSDRKKKTNYNREIYSTLHRI